MSQPNPQLDHNDFKEYLLEKAIKTGDLFDADEATKNGFYHSYNITLADLRKYILISNLITL
jgi:hypothetical protein